MAFENLDLESKVYIPTQQLISQLQNDLATLYVTIRQGLIDAHNTVAILGKEVYDNPLETLSAWYNQSVASCTELYAGFFEKVLPKAEHNYEQMLVMVSGYSDQAQNSLIYMVENPQQVSADAIESITESLSATADVSSELFEVLQEKTAEIITLLSEQPLQTLEAATMETLSALLDAYFELVNVLLVSL